MMSQSSEAESTTNLAAALPRPAAHTSSTRRFAALCKGSFQIILSVVLTSIVLAYLLWPAPVPESEPLDPASLLPADEVQVAGPRLIRISADTPLAHKLQSAVVESRSISDPLLTVTGTVVASLRPGKEEGTDFWQFNAPELLTAYTDWQRSVNDIAFSETQLKRIQELADTRVESQKKVVARLEKLVEAGTDTPKDLAVEQTNLLQFQIQGEKEVYEAQTAVRLAQRSEAALAKQLEQAGLNPKMLKTATSEVDIVLAEVPEKFVSVAKVGQSCEARFFGLPDVAFSGIISSIAPVLSQERRSLRVLFVIHDPNDKLRPGMFAEIGMGTDARQALLIDADGVVHLMRADYVFVATGQKDIWRMAEVAIGEPREGKVEVMHGLNAGDKVLGAGAVLLKPVAIRALQLPAAESSPPAAEASK
jgi:hypothetical protein